MKKRGAMELSVGTIVILVLAMTMLIMGIVLVRSIFKSATYNVASLDEKVKSEINKLFTEEDSLVVYLPGKIAEVEQGDEYGVAFGLKNLETGTAAASQFDYKVELDNPGGVQSKCGVSSEAAQGWIAAGDAGSLSLRPGQTEHEIVRFQIPTDAPICILRYRISVNKAGAFYDSITFDLKIAS